MMARLGSGLLLLVQILFAALPYAVAQRHTNIKSWYEHYRQPLKHLLEDNAQRGTLAVSRKGVVEVS